MGSGNNAKYLAFCCVLFCVSVCVCVIVHVSFCFCKICCGLVCMINQCDFLLLLVDVNCNQ